MPYPLYALIEELDNIAEGFFSLQGEEDNTADISIFSNDICLYFASLDTRNRSNHRESSPTDEFLDEGFCEVSFALRSDDLGLDHISLKVSTLEGKWLDEVLIFSIDEEHLCPRKMESPAHI